MKQRRRRQAFTAIELMVTIAIIGILIALMLPAVQQSREAARRLQCQSHLKQLGLALHNYHAVHNILPPGSITVGPAFETLSGWGWGAMLLPYLDQVALYHRIDFATNTAVGKNLTQISNTIPVWLCPTDVSPKHITAFSFDSDVAIVAAGSYPGVEAMLYETSNVRFRDVTDGLSQTLLLGEHRYERSTQTGDENTASWLGRITFSDHYVYNAIPHASISASTKINHSIFSSRHTGGAYFALGDGSVGFMAETIDSTIMSALATRSGGESVDLPF